MCVHIRTGAHVTTMLVTEQLAVHRSWFSPSNHGAGSRSLASGHAWQVPLSTETSRQPCFKVFIGKLKQGEFKQPVLFGVSYRFWTMLNMHSPTYVIPTL